MSVLPEDGEQVSIAELTSGKKFMMRIADNIAVYATDAVEKYAKISGIPQVNEVPEIFLGSFVACRLHEELGLNAHVERKYEKLAAELGIQVDKNVMGGHAADIVVYDKSQAIAIIEIKIYDEGGRPELIYRDLKKMRNISSLIEKGRLQTIAVLLVTDTVGGKCHKKRAEDLGKKLGIRLDPSGPLKICGEGETEWSWRFFCGSFSEPATTPGA